MVLRATLVWASLVVALVAATASLPYREAPVRALTNCDTSEAALDAVEQEFVRLLNAERARVGVAALAVAESLNRAAAWKSADQAATGGLSHTDSLGRGPLQRLRDCGNAAPFWGENVLVGAPSAQAAFDLWKTSDGHYQNMVSPAYAFVGVGRHGVYWTLDFSSSGDGVGGGPTLPPSPTPSLPPSPTPSPEPTATPSPTPSEPLIAVVPLSEGGNLVTYYGPPRPAGEAFAEIAPVLRNAYRWDQATGWQHGPTGVPDDAAGFATVAPGDVFYLVLEADAAWRYEVAQD